MSKFIRAFAAFSYLAILVLVPIAFVQPANAVAPQPCDQYSWTGEDDVAHQMSLPFNLPLGDTTYNTTYVTTNGTLTFGTPDATFWAYPNTPSISLAGWDWVTWGGGHLSYGVTDSGFCVEWQVRQFPQSSGDFTTIKLTVDTTRLPTWSGIVETTGWVPDQLRRGIRFTPSEDVVTISEAFTINGGRPVEMQSCWDGSVIPLTSTCPAEPPAGQCWDGSTIPWNGTCPPLPPDTQCWDGTWVTWSQTCPSLPEPIQCWDGSTVPYNQTCPPTPPDIQCWDGSSVPWNGSCIPEPQVVCWDGSTVHYQSECPPTPPDIVCWDGSTVPYNGTCLPEPPPITCWDGSTVPWYGVCTPIPPDIVCWNGTTLPWNGTCPNVPPPIECWDGSFVNWDSQCPVEPVVIIYPEGAVYITANEGWELSYTAPEGKRIKEILFASYGTPENYQYSWCNAENSMTAVANAVSNNTLTIGANNGVFGDPCGGTYKHLSVVLTIEDDPNYVPPTPVDPTPTPEPTPTPTPTDPVVDPTPTPEPTPEPTDTPVDPTPEPTPTDTPTSDPTPSVDPVPPVVPPTPKPSPSDTQQEQPTPSDSPSPTPDTPQAPTSVDELLNQYSDGQAIPADQLAALGIDYSELPPDQPVQLANGVVLTAEVADALQIFESPSEVLSAIFTDPGKALKAIANVGADMTPATRKAAQAVTVSAVIVSQVIAGTSALTLARK